MTHLILILLVVLGLGVVWGLGLIAIFNQIIEFKVSKYFTINDNPHMHTEDIYFVHTYASKFNGYDEHLGTAGTITRIFYHTFRSHPLLLVAVNEYIILVDI